MSGSAITSNGLKALATLRDLRRLSLWNVKGIDDAAAPYLESLGNLTSLDLSNTAVGDETLARLGKLSGSAPPLRGRDEGDAGRAGRVPQSASVERRVVERTAGAARAVQSWEEE